MDDIGVDHPPGELTEEEAALAAAEAALSGSGARRQAPLPAPFAPVARVWECTVRRLSPEGAPPKPTFSACLLGAATLAAFLAGLLSALLLQGGARPLAQGGAAAPSRFGVLRVALLGDSITLGQVCGSGGYEKYLAPALGERHYAVRTFAGNGLAAVAFNASGVTDPSAAGFAANYAGRAFVRSQQWLDALAFDADAYVVMLGTNDAHAEAWALSGGGAALLRDYGALLAQLRALPAGPEVLAAVPPPSQDKSHGFNATVTNALLPLQVFPALRAATGVTLIDVFSALGGSSEAGAPFFCDGVHPTKEGAKRIAMAVYEGLWRHLVVRGGWPPFRAREDFFPPGLVRR